MSFQDIVDTGFLSYNRNLAAERLKSMVEDGLIRKKNPEKKRGQKLWYVLTLKGRRWVAKKMAENITEASENLKEIVDQMSKPIKIYQFHREVFPTPSQEEFDRGYSTPEQQARYNKVRVQTFEPLRCIFGDLAKDLVKIEGMIAAREDLENVQFHFRNGTPYWYIGDEKLWEWAQIRAKALHCHSPLQYIYELIRIDQTLDVVEKEKQYWRRKTLKDLKEDWASSKSEKKLTEKDA